MIRIAYTIGALDVGGAESQLLALVERLDRRRFAPAIYCLSHEGPLAARARAAGICVTSAELKGLNAMRNPFKVGRRLLRMIRLIVADRPDIVHGFLYHGYLLGALAGRLARARAVVAGRRSLSHFKANRPLLLALERLANRWTDVLVANSEAVREDVLRTEGVGRAKVAVIYNGLDLARFEVPARETQATGFNRDGAPIAVAVANFIHYKGHPVLLDAWRVVLGQFPRAVLLLVGEGPERSKMECRVEALGIATAVRFLGTREDVPSILCAADLLVHPSSEEGFSNAILEAMAAGRPVVATAVGGNAEAVVEGETGLLVPYGDSAALAAAIVRLFQGAETRLLFGAAGRARVACRFGIERMVKEYETLYERLLEVGA